MKTYYFTFGNSPENPMLHNIAVPIDAESAEIARISMEANFGRRWDLLSDVAPECPVVTMQQAGKLNVKYYSQEIE